MKLHNIPAAAERLSIKPATLRSWVSNKQIEFVKVGRAVRISEQAIQNVIDRGTVRATRG